jgi:hypothetical protein
MQNDNLKFKMANFLMRNNATLKQRDYQYLIK